MNVKQLREHLAQFPDDTLVVAEWEGTEHDVEAEDVTLGTTLVGAWPAVTSVAAVVINAERY